MQSVDVQLSEPNPGVLTATLNFPQGFELARVLKASYRQIHNPRHALIKVPITQC